MEPDHPGVVAQGVVGAQEEEEEGLAGWGEHALEPGRVGIVSALIAELEYPIRQEPLVMI